MISNSRRKNLLLALALGLVLLLLSYARIVGDSQSMGFREEVLDTIFGGAIWGTTLMWNMVWFGVALTVLHLVFGALCWAVGTLSGDINPKPIPAEQQKQARQHVVLWFALLTIALLAANSANFSRSSLGSPYARAMGASVGGIALGNWIAGLICAIALAVVGIRVIQSLRAGWRPYRHPRRFAAGALVVSTTQCRAGLEHRESLA